MPFDVLQCRNDRADMENDQKMATTRSTMLTRSSANFFPAALPSGKPSSSWGHDCSTCRPVTACSTTGTPRGAASRSPT